MSFSKAFLEELKSRLRLSDVVGRRVKLVRAGREFKGLSPFTTEKTPSFFVNDEKGFYHCFSSGENGDVITFIEKTQNLSFHEAVKLLADEAGMELPRQTEEARAQDVRRAGLLEVMEYAARFFERELGRQKGASAKVYLQGRGVLPETMERFRLGLAPSGRSSMYDYLLQKDIPLAQMVEAGLVISPDDGGAPFDRFRDRVMFPIEDARGKVIAFGGRALSADQKAKYLNSPETPLFHKSSVLYNLKSAREACIKAGGSYRGALVVAEGYMDVISFVEAGFEGAVAPLGTALTESQIQLLWRAAPEPILCFDGDRAGQAAAYRVVDRVLPILKPGHSLKFALLPEGNDPDDLIRASGAEAMVQVLSRARPLADMLWEREVALFPNETPEQRAGLEQRLSTLVSDIQEPRVRQYYQAELKARLRGAFAPQYPVARPGAGRGFPRQFRKPSWMEGDPLGPSGVGISSSLKRSALSQSDASGNPQREALMVLTMLNHPELLENHCETFAAFEFSDLNLDRLRNEIISIAALPVALDRETLVHHLSGTQVMQIAEGLTRRRSLKIDAFVRPEASLSEAERGWTHLLGRQRSTNGLKKELREAEQALARDGTDENLARLVAIKAQLHESEEDGIG